MPTDMNRPLVHPDLVEQNKKFIPEIRTVGGRFHVAYGFSPSNCTLIEGDDGCVLVDTLPTIEFAEPVARGFKEITDKPIKAIVYTHVHPDHISGVRAFVTEEQVASGEVEIIALDELTVHLARDSGLLAPILARRAMYTFGFQLPRNEEGNVGSGLGPRNIPGQRSFIEPTRTFKGEAEFDICGIKFRAIHLPSETDDQVIVWLPEEKTLLSADVIQGETFPNVYAIRGTSFRNPMVWARAIDVMRDLESTTLIPHHGRPVEGADAIEDVLTAHRDAIQYLHDQTVRHINKGATSDEITEIVTMPSHLADHPWLGEFYGAYKHCVPAIYAGYVGSFDGDPATLDPHSRSDRAERYIEMMGGRDAVLSAAREAHEAGDYQWAAELAGWPIRVDVGDEEARGIKAAALREWGYAQKNTNWRNFALTGALELEGKLQPPRGMPFGAPDTVRTFPASRYFENLTVRLKAEEAMQITKTIGFKLSDKPDVCGLEIRRGICQFHEKLPAKSDVVLTFDRAFLEAVMLGRSTFAGGLADGQVAADGDEDVIEAFFDLFETPSLDFPVVAH